MQQFTTSSAHWLSAQPACYLQLWPPANETLLALTCTRATTHTVPLHIMQDTPSALAPVVLAFYFPKLYFSPGQIPSGSVNSKLVTCSWTPAMQSGDASVNTHEGKQTCSRSRPGPRLPSQAPSEAIKTAIASKQPKGAHALCPLKIALSIRCSHLPTEDGTMSPCQAEMDSWAGPHQVSQH